jgi:hypothetical protein
MDRETAWGGAAVERVRDAVRRALSKPSLEGERRAFALGDLTCVVEWRPAERQGGATGYSQVDIRLRRGSRQRSHATTLSSLSLLARTCEHHLLFFAREDEPFRATPATVPASGGGRTASPLSAADRLRALLHQGSHPGS